MMFTSWAFQRHCSRIDTLNLLLNSTFSTLRRGDHLFRNFTPGHRCGCAHATYHSGHLRGHLVHVFDGNLEWLGNDRYDI